MASCSPPITPARRRALGRRDRAEGGQQDAGGRLFNLVDLVNRLEDETRRGKAGALQ